MADHVNLSPELSDLRDHIIGELRELRKELSGKIDVGLAGVNTRLDTLNGRVREQEIDIAILKHDSEYEEETAREERIYDKFKAILKDYLSPASVVGMLLYLGGKSQGWW